MATIYPRHNKDGTTSWRVMIRRKGLQTFCTQFVSEDDAINFVKKYEKEYCLNPEEFTFDRLFQNRKNEFKRKDH